MGKEKSHQGTHSWGLLNTLLSIPTTGIIKSTVWFWLPFSFSFSRPVAQVTHAKHLK